MHTKQQNKQQMDLYDAGRAAKIISNFYLFEIPDLVLEFLTCME